MVVAVIKSHSQKPGLRVTPKRGLWVSVWGQFLRTPGQQIKQCTPHRLCPPVLCLQGRPEARSPFRSYARSGPGNLPHLEVEQAES